MERLISFAQDKEDVILYHILKGVDNIFWIDAGANDPIYMSVTKFFYDRGGRGINIEPQSKYFEQYNTERTRDINICCGVGDQNGSMTLYGIGTGASMLNYSLSEEANVNKVEVPIMKLSDICDQFIKKTQPIHFLKIDVEGFEKQALLGMDFQKYRPWIIVMESTLPGTDIPSHEKWEKILLENRYIFGKQIGINRFYVAQEKSNLLPSLQELDNFHNMYTVVTMVYYFDMEQEFNQLQKKYSAIINSICWKITAPIRKFGSMLITKSDEIEGV